MKQNPFNYRINYKLKTVGSRQVSKIVPGLVQNSQSKMEITPCVQVPE